MLKNSQNGYGWIAIGLHWLMAIGVFGMFGLGLYMVELTYYDRWYHGSLETHKAIGVLVFLTLSVRLLWRLVNVSPRGLSDNTFENRIAHGMHWLLYGLLFFLVTSGYLISTADGRSVDVFGWFSVPATLTGEHQEDTFGGIHEILAWLVIGSAALHALAALKHHFVNKDKTLKRMLIATKQPS